MISSFFPFDLKSFDFQDITELIDHIQNHMHKVQEGIFS